MYTKMERGSCVGILVGVGSPRLVTATYGMSVYDETSYLRFCSELTERSRCFQEMIHLTYLYPSILGQIMHPLSAKVSISVLCL